MGINLKKPKILPYLKCVNFKNIIILGISQIHYATEIRCLLIMSIVDFTVLLTDPFAFFKIKWPEGSVDEMLLFYKVSQVQLISFY